MFVSIYKNFKQHVMKANGLKIMQINTCNFQFNIIGDGCQTHGQPVMQTFDVCQLENLEYYHYFQNQSSNFEEHEHKQMELVSYSGC